MPQNQEAPALGRIAYEEATHAPLYERYMGGSFVEVGEPNPDPLPWRIHPETGTEIHAIQRSEPHTYLRDYKVGSSYDVTTFIFADLPNGETASHDEIEAFLREHDLWSDALSPVVVPDGGDDWRHGFQYRPPERAPYSLDSIQSKIERVFDLEEHMSLSNPRGFQAMIV